MNVELYKEICEKMGEKMGEQTRAEAEPVVSVDGC